MATNMPLELRKRYKELNTHISTSVNNFQKAHEEVEQLKADMNDPYKPLSERAGLTMTSLRAMNKEVDAQVSFHTATREQDRIFNRLHEMGAIPEIDLSVYR